MKKGNFKIGDSVKHYDIRLLKVNDKNDKNDKVNNGDKQNKGVLIMYDTSYD